MTPPYDSHSAFDAYDIVPASDYLPANDDTAERNRTRLARKIGYGAGAALFILLGVGVVEHYAQHREAVTIMETRQQAVPKVRVEPVKVTTTPRDLSLPGTTSAFEAATIYARQSGYIAERRVDIGAKVKAGDVLAVIAAPEVKDQLAQAKAQLTQMQAALKQAQAARTLAQATYKRTGELVTQGWASKQQGDQDRASQDTQVAAVNVAEANIVAQQAQVCPLGGSERLCPGRCAVRWGHHPAFDRHRQSGDRRQHQRHCFVLDRPYRRAARSDLCAAGRGAGG